MTMKKVRFFEDKNTIHFKQDLRKTKNTSHPITPSYESLTCPNKILMFLSLKTTYSNTIQAKYQKSFTLLVLLVPLKDLSIVYMMFSTMHPAIEAKLNQTKDITNQIKPNHKRREQSLEAKFIKEF